MPIYSHFSQGKINFYFIFSWRMNMNRFFDRLITTTDEREQVNPIFLSEITRGINRVSSKQARLDSKDRVYSDIKTDGIYRCYYINEENYEHNFLMQLECKLDIDFSDAKSRANVLLQVCCYLKEIKDRNVGVMGYWENAKSFLPKVIVLASKINCMTLPSNLLIQYAMNNIAGYEVHSVGGNLSIRNQASQAYLKPENTWLIEKIANDGNIQAHSIIYRTIDKDCISKLCSEIIKLGKDLKIADDLNEHTVSLAFDFFDICVLDSKESSRLSSREKVDLFIGTFFNEEFEESTSRGSVSTDKLRIHGVEIRVNPVKYNQFKLLYNMREYSKLEQKQITAITDRLIEDTDRRRKGDFYTPTIWVDAAHKLLEKNLGKNWKDDYIVWDCAWGTGNLTRDYKFSSLYCSTFSQSDLNISTRYNKKAVKFQYDFLNDDVEEMEEALEALRTPLKIKGVYSENFEPYINFRDVNRLYSDAVEKGILSFNECISTYKRAVGMLKRTKLYKSAPQLIDNLLSTDKPLVFFINPPYGTSKNNSTNKENNSKAGIAKTGIRDVMAGKKLGMAQRQLYTQFLFRCIEIMRLFGNKGAIGAFTQSDFLTTVSYGEFRKYLYGNSKYLDGFQFSGGYFDKVKQYVGLTFTIWDASQKTNEQISIDIVDLGETPDKLNVIRKKDIIIPEKLFNVEIRDTLAKAKKTKQKKECLALKSGLNVREDEPVTLCLEGSLGGFQCNSNDVNQNAQRVALFSSQFFGPANMDIIPETFCDAMTLFTVRRLIVPDWINWKDEYAVPNKDDERYAQFEADSIVYSLFESKSQQTSMRNLFYNGKTWDIYNEFFWLSVKDIENLAGGLWSKEDINGVIENDLEDFGQDRFVYKKLQTVTLSTDAQEVLDCATKLLMSSFKYRSKFNKEHPEYHINTWDAGWYQIKGLLKEYDKDGLRQFEVMFKQFEDRMRPLVYELGFLCK